MNTLERSKSTEKIDYNKIGCLNLKEPLVKVSPTDKITVEPVWELDSDFDGIMYAEYISEHPEYDGIYLRQEVLSRLEKAADNLPNQYKLVLRAGHRPLDVQRRILQDCIKDYKLNNPESTDKEALEHARTFVDDPRVSLPSHCGGGSVDVELFDVSKNRLVDFGSPRDLDSEVSFLHSEEVGAEQNQNRMLLLTTMLNAGFASVYSEWWHFSYGDQVWAWFYGHKDSLYGAIDLGDELATLKWDDYIESGDISSKMLFDADLSKLEGTNILLTDPTFTLYTTDLYPKSRFLIALGDLNEIASSLPLDSERSTFIKLKVLDLNADSVEKIYDSYEVDYSAGKKKSLASLNIDTQDCTEEVVDIYIANHRHHENINRTLISNVIKSYGLQKLCGKGFNIYLEDLGESYETSFFSTDGTDAGKRALLKQLKDLGSFEMELDSTLSEFELLKADLAEYCKYSCSLYRIVPD